MSKHLNPSEAVYGFAAWFTTKKEKTIMSAADDSAPIAELVAQFCEANNLPSVSENWPLYLMLDVSGEVAVPGIGVNQ
jgi:hypothetical protein